MFVYFSGSWHQGCILSQSKSRWKSDNSYHLQQRQRLGTTCSSNNWYERQTCQLQAGKYIGSHFQLLFALLFIYQSYINFLHMIL